MLSRITPVLSATQVERHYNSRQMIKYPNISHAAFKMFLEIFQFKRVFGIIRDVTIPKPYEIKQGIYFDIKYLSEIPNVALLMRPMVPFVYNLLFCPLSRYHAFCSVLAWAIFTVYLNSTMKQLYQRPTSNQLILRWGGGYFIGVEFKDQTRWSLLRQQLRLPKTNYNNKIIESSAGGRSKNAQVPAKNIKSQAFTFTTALHSFLSIAHRSTAPVVNPQLPHGTFTPSIQPNLGLACNRLPIAAIVNIILAINQH